MISRFIVGLVVWLAACKPHGSSSFPFDDMALVPGGRWTDALGAAWRVDDFRLDRTEVSVADYQACVNAGVCAPPAGVNAPKWGCLADDTCRRRELRKGCNAFSLGRDNHPMNCVSLRQSQQYCEWVGKRLPTIAEWRWEVMGGDAERQAPWGNGAPDCAQARVRGCRGRSRGGTAPVDSMDRGASRHGVLHLVGNVIETVVSADFERFGGVGGSYYRPYDQYRSFSDEEYIQYDIDSSQAGARVVDIGFRCAASVPASEVRWQP